MITTDSKKPSKPDISYKVSYRYRASRFVVVCLLAFALSISSLLTACASNSSEEYEESDEFITIRMVINCEEAVEAGNETALTTAGSGIMYEDDMEFYDGATVLDALSSCGLDLASKSSSEGVYIKSIGGLAEKEIGDLSRWVYYVNGEAETTTCDASVLKNGDIVEWKYELGS